eukprot:jgi/Bigna1/70701/fgenesh1_pg.13_\
MSLATESSSSSPESKFEFAPLNLDKLRRELVRLEDTIIFGLIERSQFKQNPTSYKKEGICIKGAGGATQFQGSYFSYYLTENEKVHAAMRRYTSPDEHPFTPYKYLPKPMLPELSWPKALREPNGKWNFNDKILDFYMNKVLTTLCKEGEDQHFGSSVTCDGSIEALSKRINYGKFVAEIKYRNNRQLVKRLLEAKDIKGIRSMITKPDVEEKILQRVKLKAVAYGNPEVLSMLDDEIGQQPKQKEIDRQKGKLDPKAISDLYEEIMELTKQVQMKYLLERPLDD